MVVIEPTRTFWPLLANPALQPKVQGLTAHLAGEHQEHLDLPGRPYYGYVDDTEGLRDKSEPGGQVGEGISGVLKVCFHLLALSIFPVWILFRCPGMLT